MTLDITKPVQTRDGRPVRILCTDKKGDFSIVALITNQNGNEELYTYTSNGYFCRQSDSDCDLVNIPERIERWLNIYHPSLGHSVYPEYCTTRTIADNQAGPNRIGVMWFLYEDDRIISYSYTAV